MPDSIRDGSGTGNVTKVDANNRLHVSAETIPTNWNANREGNAYNVNTGIITLTDGVETPIMYLKNNEDWDLHVTAMAVGVGASSGGSGMNQITVVRNPETIDFSTAVDISGNRNYGSANTLTVTAYKGATGDTMTDGDDHILFFQGYSGRLFATIDEVIPSGKTIGLKFDPAGANTSVDVYSALICHLVDPEGKN